ncbi:MAG: MFS transporter [Dehalococcoidia bacterium]|nr:MFS transporter [Dehalococcoidia bacterium]
MLRLASTNRVTELFSVSGYRPLWLGAVLFALGAWSERVAVGWYVFETTDSAFITSLATTAFIAPSLLVGPIGGAISDRLPRPNVLATAALLKASPMFVIAFLVRDAEASLPLILLLLMVSGVGISLNISSLHTLSGDLVGAQRRARAISVVSTGQRAIAAAGALGSGALITAYGATPAFLLAGSALVLAALSYRMVREPSVRRGSSGMSFLGEAVDGLRLVTRIPFVAIMLALTVIVEIFGFAFMSLFPAMVERNLHLEANALGALTAAASIGGVVGTLTLAFVADRRRLGVVFLVVIAIFGVLMATIGVSEWFRLSLALAGGIGCCAAMFDALQWILLQAGVDDSLRGRALGAWNVAIGFGWIGPLALGGVADAVSVTAAFVLAGIVLVVTASIVAVGAKQIRTMAG